jgi:hypothetical protein
LECHDQKACRAARSRLRAVLASFKQMCARIAAKRWSARVIYLRPPPGIRVTELLADDGETKEAEGKKEGVPWPSWGKFVDRLSAAAAAQ